MMSVYIYIYSGCQQCTMAHITSTLLRRSRFNVKLAEQEKLSFDMALAGFQRGA